MKNKPYINIPQREYMELRNIKSYISLISKQYNKAKNKGYDMTTRTKSEKVTITIPSELKEQLNTSVSSIHKEALEAYLESKEMRHWERGAQLAQKDQKYMKFVEELSHDNGDIYEYEQGEI